jgi:hypothetical protein
MKNSKVMIGEQHNTLTAVKQIHKDKWLWKCNCGNLVESSSYSVRSGNRKSCGCVHKAKIRKILSERSRKEENESCRNTLFLALKSSAKKRNHLFEIKREYVDVVTQQHCYYCGIEPSNTMRVPHNTDILKYNGLDRIDNTKGYTESNTVPCCRTCNIAKNTMSIDEFKTWICKLFTHLTNKE